MAQVFIAKFIYFNQQHFQKFINHSIFFHQLKTLEKLFTFATFHLFISFDLQMSKYNMKMYCY